MKSKVSIIRNTSLNVISDSKYVLKITCTDGFNVAGHLIHSQTRHVSHSETIVISTTITFNFNTLFYSLFYRTQLFV